MEFLCTVLRRTPPGLVVIPVALIVAALGFIFKTQGRIQIVVPLSSTLKARLASPLLA